MKLIEEIYRVLRSDGSFVLISGNEEFVTYPYLMNDKFLWEIEVHPLVAEKKVKKSNNDFTSLTISLYVLRKKE